MLRARPSQDIPVLAFVRHDETSSLVVASIVLTPHRDGPGFNVQLRALPLDGRVVLLPPDRGEERNRAR